MDADTAVAVAVIVGDVVTVVIWVSTVHDATAVTDTIVIVGTVFNVGVAI